MERSEVKLSRHCRDCGELIIFSDDVRGKNGTRVPMNPDGSRHDCLDVPRRWVA